MASQPPFAPAPAGLPSQALNQQDVLGGRTRVDIAKRVAEGHRIGLQSRRFRDLTAEKYLLHIDGEGDAQYADIFEGSRIVIPVSLTGSVRIPNNLLRPMTDNMVAYNCTQEFAFIAESRQDRDSREKARLDAAIVNHVNREQRWRAKTAEAMYMAAAYGMCQLHAGWSDDLGFEAMEPLYHTPQQAQQQGLYAPRRGRVDCWVGNPFDTVYNPGAKRGSVQWMSYGRVLPGDYVRGAFPGAKGIAGLTGSKRVPSASVSQRIMRKWMLSGINVHGSAVQTGGGEQFEEELVAIVCREWMPGVLPDYQDGRLVIVGLRLSASGDLDTSANATPLLLHDGPLPARRRSAVEIYSGFRFDDVLGKPYVADLDDKQTQLNLLENLADDYFRKAVRAPLRHDGLISDATLAWDDDGVVETRPGGSAEWMVPPADHMNYLERKIERVEQAMFRIGGWQAASRGEAQAGQPAALAVYLGRADDTVHGPINLAMRDSLCDYAALTWSLFKEYGDAGWALNVVGDDDAHLVENYIDNTKLSDSVPHFRMVSGTGATTEATEQQLLNMVVAKAADGSPLLTAAEFRKKWPDQDLYDTSDDPATMKRRHARTVAAAIRKLSRQAGQQLQQMPPEFAAVQQQQVVAQVFQQVMAQYRPRRDDDIQALIDAMSDIVQDDTEDSIARDVGEAYQNVCYDRQMQAALQARQWQQGPQPAGPQNMSPGQGSAPPQATQGAEQGNTPSSKSAEMAMGQVPGLTQEAQAMG